MAPFRLTNLNKRAYPGNANVVGPTRSATVGYTTTTCNTCFGIVCGTQSAETFTLGCRCTTFTCPFCHRCCCCICTVCTRTTPSGMWGASEVYEARTRDSWGPSTCSNEAPIQYCSACCGTFTSIANDCKGFYICCGPSTNKWFVAPSFTEICTTWYCYNDAVTTADNNLGSCGWFVPNSSQIGNPGYSCRTFWDTYTSSCYWSSTQSRSYAGYGVNFADGSTFQSYNALARKECCYRIRTLRCTP